MGQYYFARCRLSSSVVCRLSSSVTLWAGVGCRPPSGRPPGAWAVGRPILHGGPVRLRTVTAIPCSMNFTWTATCTCTLSVVGSHVVRASDMQLNGREFDPGPPHHWSVGTGISDRLRAGIPSRYCKSPRPIQPPTLCGTGNEYRSKCGDVLRLEVKAGWLIPFVDKNVGGR